MACGCPGCCFGRILKGISMLLMVMLVCWLAYVFVFVRSLTHTLPAPLEMPAASMTAQKTVFGRLMTAYSEIVNPETPEEKVTRLLLSEAETNALISVMMTQSQLLTAVIPKFSELQVGQVARSFGETWAVNFRHGEFCFSGLTDIGFIPGTVFLLDGGYVNIRTYFIPSLNNGAVTLNIQRGVIGSRAVPNYFLTLLEKDLNEEIRTQLADPKVRLLLASLQFGVEQGSVVLTYKPVMIRKMILGY